MAFTDLLRNVGSSLPPFKPVSPVMSPQSSRARAHGTLRPRRPSSVGRRGARGRRRDSSPGAPGEAALLPALAPSRGLCAGAESCVLETGASPTGTAHALAPGASLPPRLPPPSTAVRCRPCHLCPANRPPRPLLGHLPGEHLWLSRVGPARVQPQSDPARAIGQVAKRVNWSLLGFQVWKVPGQPHRSQRATAWEMLVVASNRC